MFFTFESTEGGGKGHLSKALVKALEMAGKTVIHTRQPGGTPEAEVIRELILRPNSPFTAEEQAMLVLVSRKRVFEETIRPALDQGAYVVCERWNLSTVAYQANAAWMGSEINQDLARRHIQSMMIKLGLLDYVPDISVLLNVDTRTGLSRIQERKFIDHFELKNLSWHETANACFRTHHQKKTRWLMKDSLVVNSNQTLEWACHELLTGFWKRGIISREIAEQVARSIQREPAHA